MGQVLHGSATTTEAVRRAIQHSQESLRALAKRYGVNPKTVAKWKARSSVSDLPTGPKAAQIDGPVGRGRGRRRRLPKAYAAAARRLPLRPAADDPASDALVPSPVSATPRDLPVAPGRRRSLRQTQIQDLSDRLFSISTSPRFEPRKASSTSSSPSTERRSSPSSSCTRRWRAAPRGLPAPPDRRRPLQGPHRPHRQRNPLHHARQYELGCAGHQGRPGGWRTRLGARLRIRLRPERHRSSADQAQSSLDH